MKVDLPYLKFVVVVGNAEVECAAFQYVKEAEAFIERRGDYGAPSVPLPTAKILQRIDGRRVIGCTDHGNAILDSLAAHRPVSDG